jgi:hypothetical protein
MALIAVTADKGAPGVTTACVALAAVWPRPVLLAECDPAGGDLVYRLPAASGGQLDPNRGLLSLAVALRRGLELGQAWEHTQKLHGGLDLLVGVVTPEQGAGLDPLWGPVGAALAQLPDADTIADCGRIGVAGPHYDLLAQASLVVLVTRATLGDVVRVRERVAVLAPALARRGERPPVGVVVVAEHRGFHAAVADVGQALGLDSPAAVLGGLAYEPRSADLLRGEWGGKLERSLLIRTARELAGRITARLPAPALGQEPATAQAPPVAKESPAAREPAPEEATEPAAPVRPRWPSQPRWRTSAPPARPPSSPVSAPERTRARGE